jgi:hypothetical protein
MRSLKLLVVVMGVLLIAGIIALGFAVNYRMKHPRADAAPQAPISSATPGTIDLPPGSRVVGTEVSGDRLVVRVELAGGGGEELIFVNIETGAPVSTLILKPKAATP